MISKCFPALVLFFCISCVPTNQCINKEAFLSNLDRFVEDVRTHHEKFEASDWEEIDEEFERFADDCYHRFKKDMTSSDKFEFWKNAISYGYYRGAGSREIRLELENLKLDLKTDLKEFSAETVRDLEKAVVEDLGDEISTAVDEIESLADELKKWLEDK